MSSLEMVRSAQDDVTQLQSALSAVQTGLDNVEVAVVTVDTVRRGFRRLVKIGVVLLVAGVVAVVVMKVMQRDDEQSPA